MLPQPMQDSKQEMGTATTAELPYHLAPESHLGQKHLPTFNLSQKTILDLLNTRCSNSYEHLKQVHALVVKTGHLQDHFVAGTLVKCYANPQFGSLDCSIKVVQQVPNPNVFVWNSMIKGCLDNEEHRKALSFYYRMVVLSCRTNNYTYPPLFKACSMEQAVEEGLQIHAHVVKNSFVEDGHVRCSGIQMYASFGRVEDARKLLDAGGETDVVCCNAMIDGYMKCGDVDAARGFFEEMVNKNIGSWNAMINGFMINGMIDKAKDYFNEMPEKDEISWSVMLDGYNRGGQFKEALEVFTEMQRENVKLRKFILSSALATCANLGALDQGKWIHTYIRRNSIPLDAVLGTSLLDMYAKCGRIDLAWDIFENMKQKKVFSWNAMIGALAMHGRAEDAFDLFFQMQRERFKPNDITFVAILNACAHAGLVDEGMKYLNDMKEVYGVEPTVEHYGCAVDILGRAGLLGEALELINSMPMKPNAAVWGALLGACRIHKNIELAEKVGRILLEMEPENSGRYALLSNIYAKAGRWDDATKIRMLMKERGVRTIPGRSMIDLDGVVHEFRIGEQTHPQSKDVYLMLGQIMRRLQLAGHVPNTSQVLFDIGEEEKQTALRYHTERLAIAFGLLKTAPGSTIHVTNNLRVCEDCHSVVKLISKIYSRQIILRDRVRYHHFSDGHCSCKDFW
ncbi:pentatricopeptide repeat-containing protein At5g66520-like [Coffea arabica]|uniref:Pentatricopeptide repeat-containing protein At5g66520-like n=1 Tax=Coffea arabica TaxID=13443 RepID=A0A6P6WHG2_COFAR